MLIHEENGMRVEINDGEIVLTYHENNLPGNEDNFDRIKIVSGMFGGFKITGQDKTVLGQIFGNEVNFRKPS